jgi:hypothetical protein
VGGRRDLGKTHVHLVPVEEIVTVLDGDHFFHAQDTGSFQEFHHTVRAFVAQADVADLTGLDQLAEGGELLFEADEVFALALCR